MQPCSRLSLNAPAVAQACSRDDSVFYETFIDLTCLQQPLTNTTFDALGGLRLTTNGTSAATTWDSHTDFDNGVAHESVTYPPWACGRSYATAPALGPRSDFRRRSYR